MRPDMEVLEFGCGTESTALEHAPHVAHIEARRIRRNDRYR
jgi:cyclopropane fatty-acyl-phospholipid synthase-like methyltransferase